ncbi:MAG: carbon-nitrogen hydrolase family protein [Gemmatimonadetes bacterium]|nr:carbon-nitrogen hydrolase family protein [Gemmatimonadota bacterium]
MQPFAIAGLQLQLSGHGNNLPRMHERLDFLMAVFPWVQMVVFSELAACGWSPAHAQAMPGPAEQEFQWMAVRHKVWLVSGSHFELAEGGKVYNTASVIDPEGVVVARHRKLFPFLPYEQGVSAGSNFVVFDIPDVGRFGVSICYDMWFPETSRQLAAMGAEVIIHPTLTSTIDRDVELSIARATAATNQCFMVDINGVGDVGNGRSVVIGPAGDVIYQAGTSEELIPIEVDLARVRRSREVGLRGLGQPLKSFRDSTVRFPVYAGETREYLETLGPLARAERGTRAGIRGVVPTPEHATIPVPGMIDSTGHALVPTLPAPVPVPVPVPAHAVPVPSHPAAVLPAVPHASLEAPPSVAPLAAPPGQFAPSILPDFPAHAASQGAEVQSGDL